MVNKLCTKCKLTKKLNEFPPHRKYKSGRNSWCRKCKNQYMRAFRKNYPWLCSYKSAKNRCNNKNCNDYKDYGGRGIRFLLTKEQIKKLWYRDKGYKLTQHSIDRIDNDGDYTFNNCRFIELSENSIKQEHNKKEKEVYQYSLQGKSLNKWKSMSEISNKLNYDISGISKACSGKQKTSYGFIWKLKEMEKLK